MLWKVQYLCEFLECVKSRVSISCFLFYWNIKFMPSCLYHILFLFLSLNCSCDLQGFHFNAPVCDWSHKLQEDVTCQNPITPFMFFLLARWHAAQTVLPFNFFFFLGKYRIQITSCSFFQRDNNFFLSCKIQNTNSKLLVISKGQKHNVIHFKSSDAAVYEHS